MSFADDVIYKRLTRCFGLAGMGLEASGVPVVVKNIIASMRDEPQNLDGRRAEVLRWSSVAQLADRSWKDTNWRWVQFPTKLMQIALGRTQIGAGPKTKAGWT